MKLTRDGRREDADDADSLPAARRVRRHADLEDPRPRRCERDRRQTGLARPRPLADAPAAHDDLNAGDGLARLADADADDGVPADGERPRRHPHRVAHGGRRERALHQRRCGRGVVGRILLGLPSGDDGRVGDRAGSRRPHDDRDRHELVVGDRVEVAGDRDRARARALRRRDRYERHL